MVTVLLLAREMGMLKIGTVALDGTKIQFCCHRRLRAGVCPLGRGPRRQT